MACEACKANDHTWTAAQTETFPLPYGSVRLYHYSCACWVCLMRCGAGLVHVDQFVDGERTMEITFVDVPPEEKTPLPQRAPRAHFDPDRDPDAQITQATTTVTKETMEKIVERLREL